MMEKLSVRLDYLVISEYTKNIFENIVEDKYQIIKNFGKYKLQIKMGRGLILYIMGNKGNLPIYIYDCVYPANLFIEELMENARSISFYNLIDRDEIYYDLCKLTKYKKLRKFFNFYIKPDLHKHLFKIEKLDYYLKYYPEWKNKTGAAINLIPFVKLCQSSTIDKRINKELDEIVSILFKSPFVLEKISYQRFFKELFLTFKNKKTKAIVTVSSSYSPQIYELFIKRYKKYPQVVAKAILKDVEMNEREFLKHSGKSAFEWARILLSPERLLELQLEDNYKFAKMFSYIHSLA